MFRNQTLLAFAVSGMLLVGCDSKKTESTTPAPADAPAIPAAPAPTSTPTTLPSAPMPPTPLTPTLTPATQATPSVTPQIEPSVTPVAPGASVDANANAQITLTQFGKDLVAKDWKAAAADLKTLEDEKSQLTPQLQDVVKNAQTQYEAAKAANKLNIPGFGDSNK